MFNHLRKTALMLAICLCFSLSAVYAATIDETDADSNKVLLAQYEITIDESGSVSIENTIPDTNASSPRDIAVGYINYEKVGNNLYQFELEANGGAYYTIGSASVTVDYGDGTIGVFTHGNTHEDLAFLTTPAAKYYAPGTYTVKATSGYINTYDHFGTLDQITSDKIPL